MKNLIFISIITFISSPGFSQSGCGKAFDQPASSVEKTFNQTSEIVTLNSLNLSRTDPKTPLTPEQEAEVSDFKWNLATATRDQSVLNKNFVPLSGWKTGDPFLEFTSSSTRLNQTTISTGIWIHAFSDTEGFLKIKLELLQQLLNSKGYTAEVVVEDRMMGLVIKTIEKAVYSNDFVYQGTSTQVLSPEVINRIIFNLKMIFK